MAATTISTALVATLLDRMPDILTSRLWSSGLHEPSPIEARRVYQFFRVTLASGDSKDSDALQINANARILKAGETIVRDLRRIAGISRAHKRSNYD